MEITVEDFNKIEMRAGTVAVSYTHLNTLVSFREVL